MDETFSVCQFLADDTYEYVRRYVSLDEAIKAFKHYSSSVAVTLGYVTRVIITDTGDSIVAEWIYGKGITYPTKEDEPM